MEVSELRTGESRAPGARILEKRVGEKNVGAHERIPRVAVAIASATGAVFAPRPVLRGLLYGLAAAMLATVATGYCPINALTGRGTDDAGEWRTIRTWRVNA